MRYSLYLGCTIQAEQFGYEASVREALPQLGVELVDLENTSCCGYPAFKSISPLGWLYLSARNLAIAETQGFDLLPLCNGCHLSFIEAKHTIDVENTTRDFVNENLEKEGLSYTGAVDVVHIIELLHDIIGTETIAAAVKKPLKISKVAAHPGCHAIRPSKIGRPDDAEHPQKLDALIQALGAETMDYPEKTDCCGSLLALYSGKTTLTVAGEKLKAVKKYGFESLVTTCPFCFKMYDSKQRAIQAAMGDPTLELPIFYYTQLLGLAMDLSPDKLGLKLNLSPIDSTLEKIRRGST